MMKISDLFIVFLIIAVIIGAILVVMVISENRDNIQTRSTERTYTKTYTQPQAPATDIEKINLQMNNIRLEEQVDDLKDEVNDLEDDVDDLEDEVSTQRNLVQYYQRLYEDERDNNDDDDNDDEYDLTIVVSDAETGERIEDAEVEIEDGDDEREYTNYNGRAYFDNLEEDRYDIYISASGYRSEEDSFKLDDDDTKYYWLEPRE